MAERLIPISRKQHDAINALFAAIMANQSQLTGMANTLLMGQDDDFGTCSVVAARTSVGENDTALYHLVVETVDIAPPAEVKSA